ncbi:MAG: hypothetical protein PHC41_12535 [Lachnospiraceae bacterium]|nr:hypothetical protein [Lachnospiraceae bacterium]MDD3617034.1 hypothetical protein [Lachnospiraceae bacterium]
MRLEEFKMERQGLVTEGQEVEIFESELPTSYYYTIAPAVGMSRNYAYYEKILSRKGIVKAIEHKSTGYYVLLELDEEAPAGDTESNN